MHDIIIMKKEQVKLHSVECRNYSSGTQDLPSSYSEADRKAMTKPYRQLDSRNNVKFENNFHCIFALLIIVWMVKIACTCLPYRFNVHNKKNFNVIFYIDGKYTVFSFRSLWDKLLIWLPLTRKVKKAFPNGSRVIQFNTLQKMITTTMTI